GNIKNSSVAFYDASIKLTHKFSEKDKLSFSGYASKDHFRLPSDTTFIWSNQLGSLHYDHIFNERAFGSIMVGYGKYGYEVTDRDPNTAYQMNFNISYPTLKADFNYQLGRHKLMVGINETYYKLSPGTINPTSPESTVVPLSIPQQQSMENAAFI